MFVIQCGKGYVAKPGSKSSYTTRLEEALKYNTREEAGHSKCGNESVISVWDLLK